MSLPIRHSLPNARIEARFGSSPTGNCSSVIHGPSPQNGLYRGSICNGTSVLNDGIIPALSDINWDSGSLSNWATQLLAMKNENNLPIVLSFQVENQVYNCIELAVFNCPEENVNASIINIYRDTSFRPENENESLGVSIKSDYSLSNTSCDYLLKFYVNIMSEVKSSYYNIEFPTFNPENFIYVGEVSFLTGADDCERWPPELIETTNYLRNSNRM